METYKVLLKKSAAKELEKVPEKDRKKIFKNIRDLSLDPRPQGVKKLSGQEKYRIRQGNYRILYQIVDEELIIYDVGVGHRKDIFRN